ncbi:MAG: polysaccharide biosynthesis protein, partial [Stigonema ocellatum SAG 48.90 = DSM 106950]|nr:polysaccharide biosynthesis protein [Stigonema ocellatum SAG 48.90 = DSM 106950]
MWQVRDVCFLPSYIVLHITQGVFKEMNRLFMFSHWLVQKSTQILLDELLKLKNSNLFINPNQERVLVVGAGIAGVSLVQEMQRNPQLGFQPVAFVDDDKRKIDGCIQGIPVVGDRHQIADVVKFLQIQKVIIAMPTVALGVIREIVDICKATGIPTTTIPGIHEILHHPVGQLKVPDVRIEDLLRREPVQTDIERVAQFIKGKKVLITGAGGSIGSELCRQILQ